MYFGKNRVISKIGEGGMANVYLVEDKNGNKYALKEMKSEFTDDYIKRKRFRNESTAIRKLRHPNIIRIKTPSHKVRVESKGRYRTAIVYLMEYFQNQSLKEFLEKKQQLNNQEINHIFTKLLSALELCHSKRIFHRDLKPANILLKRKNNQFEPIITDFGVAKIKNKEFATDEDLTREVTMLGAPAYMSPEQIQNPAKIDNRSDLYSVGVILYEVATGERPFKGSRGDLITQHLTSTPLPPSKINNNLSPEFEKLILQLLEKDKKKRPNSATIAREKLENSTTITKNEYKRTKIFGKKTYTSISISIKEEGHEHSYKLFTKFPIKMGTGTNYPKTISNYLITEKHPKIESEHCEILINELDQVRLRDLSTIGTIVNKRKIINSIAELHSGNNVIKLPGRLTMLLHIKQELKLSSEFIAVSILGSIILVIIILFFI